MLEIDKDEENNHYLIVHSGSRHLGKELTEYYLNQGQRLLKEKGETVPYELTWLEGELKLCLWQSWNNGVITSRQAALIRSCVLIHSPDIHNLYTK